MDHPDYLNCVEEESFPRGYFLLLSFIIYFSYQRCQKSILYFLFQVFISLSTLQLFLSLFSLIDLQISFYSSLWIFEHAYFSSTSHISRRWRLQTNTVGTPGWRFYHLWRRSDMISTEAIFNCSVIMIYQRIYQKGN